MLTDEAMDDLRWKSELIGGVVPIRPEELRDLLDEIARLRAENELQATLYCAAIDDLTSQNDKLRAENERLKAARLRPETVREVLTMERIEREVSAWKRNGEPEGIVGKAHYLELCRLALLGLERDERAERIGRAVLEQEGDETPRDLRCRAAQAERYGYESYGALLLAVADAMEDEA